LSGILGGPDEQLIALVLVHSHVVVTKEGNSSRNAKMGAAEQTMLALRGLSRTAFKAKYMCDCKVLKDEQASKDSVD
jgi:hypothetical protein